MIFDETSTVMYFNKAMFCSVFMKGAITYAQDAACAFPRNVIVLSSRADSQRVMTLSPLCTCVPALMCLTGVHHAEAFISKFVPQ